MKQIIFLCKDNKFETFLSPKVLFVHVEYHNKSSKLSHLLAEVNIVINHCSTSKLLCLNVQICLVAMLSSFCSKNDFQRKTKNVAFQAILNQLQPLAVL